MEWHIPNHNDIWNGIDEDPLNFLISKDGKHWLLVEAKTSDTKLSPALRDVYTPRYRLAQFLHFCKIVLNAKLMLWYNIRIYKDNQNHVHRTRRPA